VTNEGADVNPYAAPTAELAPKPPASGAGQSSFYAQSPAKLAVMSILTMGVYDLAYWWRQWRAWRQSGHDVNVFARTIFSPLFAFGFRSNLDDALSARGRSAPSQLTFAPFVYLIAQVLDNVLARLPLGPAVTLGTAALARIVCAAFALVTFQNAVAQVQEAEGYSGPVNRGASLGTIVAGALGALIWAAVVWGAVDGES
jgi:hypothetical protein